MSTHAQCFAEAKPVCCSAAQITQIVTGALAIIGAATILWVIFANKRSRDRDPQVEIDQRISALEDSLSHLQDALDMSRADSNITPHSHPPCAEVTTSVRFCFGLVYLISYLI